MTRPTTEADGAAIVRAYLDRLRDALPPGRAEEVTAEVASLIEDRIEAEGTGPATPDAARRALAAFGAPETLAAELSGEAPMAIPVGTRRAYVRMLAVVFGAHLLLSIVLTAVAADALLPGLLSPLPSTGWLATVAGVLGVFFLDAGLLGVLFAIVGRERAPALLPHLSLAMPGTRRDAALSLVLVALLAVIWNVPSVRDVVFSVAGAAGVRVPVLSATALGLIPIADVVLALVAVRHVVLLAGGRERVLGLVGDALASLAGATLAVLVLTRDELVRIPPSAALTALQADVFSDLLYRVVLVVAFVAGVLLVTRFVKRALRLRDVLVA